VLPGVREDRRVRAVEALGRLGGTATRQELRLAQVHRRHLDTVLQVNRIVRSARGHYRLPGCDLAQAAAHRLSAAASHTSAAMHWGWKVKAVPERPHVTVRGKRSLPRGASDGAVVHWRDLSADDVEGSVTGRVRTVIDCCLDLPLDEALRSSTRPAGAVFASATCRRDPRGSHPGSGPRSTASSPCRTRVPRTRSSRRCGRSPCGSRGLRVEPQTRIRYEGFSSRVDLADDALPIVLEADSHALHTGRRALDRDCRRYNGLVVRDWIVLRFTWEQVMFEPDTVRSAIEATVTLRRVQGVRRDRRGRATGTNPRWDLPDR
jgi:very-short-patch-repair endonuclease